MGIVEEGAEGQLTWPVAVHRHRRPGAVPVPGEVPGAGIWG
ncbi:MAG: hypothetical protein ACRDY3_12380 [Acidimicrobiales bacterium]